jgi:hypothetical protein
MSRFNRLLWKDVFQWAKVAVMAYLGLVVAFLGAVYGIGLIYAKPEWSAAMTVVPALLFIAALVQLWACGALLLRLRDEIRDRRDKYLVQRCLHAQKVGYAYGLIDGTLWGTSAANRRQLRHLRVRHLHAI